MTPAVATPKTLTAHEHQIHAIFSDSFVFSIPDYQRPYSWTIEQAGDLLDDLLDALGDGNTPVGGLNPYFLGSVVLIKGQTPHAEVVDGQQRLTTLTILISAIRSLVGPERKQFLSKKLYQEGDPFVGTEDRFRLTLRERDAEFFRENVQREGGMEKLEALADSLPDSQKNVRENALHLKKKLTTLDQEKLEILAQFVLTRCYLVVVSTPDLDSAYRIFSVLNDRGLELSHADILKAEIIGAIPEASRGAYAEKWEDIEEEIGRGAFQNLFGHIRMIFRMAKAQGTLLEEFRAYVRPKDTPTSFIDDQLRPMARAHGEITGACFESAIAADQINAVARNLSLIDNNDWIPPAIRFMYSYRNQPELLLRYLQDLERLAAGTMIIRTNFNCRMERYGRLLRALETGQDLFEPDSPLQLTEHERAEAIRILDGDLYNTRIRIPVLLRLDGILADEGATYEHRVITVEHVLPQNPADDSVWLQWFPDEEERYEVTHRISNLVLLSRRKNSQAQNWDFERKKQEYFQRSSTVRLNGSSTCQAAVGAGGGRGSPERARRSSQRSLVTLMRRCCLRSANDEAPGKYVGLIDGQRRSGSEVTEGRRASQEVPRLSHLQPGPRRTRRWQDSRRDSLAPIHAFPRKPQGFHRDRDHSAGRGIRRRTMHRLRERRRPDVRLPRLRAVVRRAE
jgi:hypothetical protein